VAYPDRQIPSRLGGVPFGIASISGEAGRRVVSLEFPGRDRPSSEDLGRAARRWSVEAVLVGPDFDVELQRWRALVESAGPHEFDHPTLGKIHVVLDGKAKESIDYNDAAGSARLSFAVVESGEEDDHLAVAVSTSAALSAASVATSVALASAFEDAWDVSAGGSTWTRAVADITSAMNVAKLAAAKVAAALAVADTVSDRIADIEDFAGDLAAIPASLVANVQAALGLVSSLIKKVDAEDESETSVAAGARVRAVLEAVNDSVAWDPEVELASPSAGAAQAGNDIAMQQLLAVSHLVMAADVLAVIALDSADTATSTIDALATAIEALLEDVDDGLYAALVDLRAAIDAHLRDLAGRLPSLAGYTPAETMPALLIAWDLYGDPERDVEIAARNNLEHPSFVPGGSTIEVLLG
jgi:prophage DNA circulation protein